MTINDFSTLVNRKYIAGIKWKNPGKTVICSHLATPSLTLKNQTQLITTPIFASYGG